MISEDTYREINKEVKWYLEEHLKSKEWSHISISDKHLILDLWELNESFFEQQMIEGKSLPVEFGIDDFTKLADNNDFITLISVNNVVYAIFEENANIDIMDIIQEKLRK